MTDPTLAQFRDWSDSQRQKREERLSVEVALGRIRSAQVSMHKLEASPEWRPFLEMAEALCEANRKAIADLEMQLSDSIFIPEAVLAEIRHRLVVHRVELARTEQLMALPAQVKAIKPKTSQKAK